jgi:glutathione S-transferase
MASDAPDSTLVLYTIPFSHYCELGRWSLQLAGIPFEERGRLPGVHLLSVPQARWEAGGGRTSATPLLVRETHAWTTYLFGWFGAGKHLVGTDSWAIADYAEATRATREGRQPQEINADVRTLLNGSIGPSARSWVYSYFLAADASGSRDKGRPMACLCENEEASSSTQRTLWGFMKGTVAGIMWNGMVRDETHVRDCKAQIDAGLAQLDALVDDMGPWDGSNPPTITQLAVASICAPLVSPPQAFAGICSRNILPLQELPVAMQEEIAKYRATKTGQCVLRLYATARLACVPMPRDPAAFV